MIFENMICLSYLGCSSSFKFEFILYEQLVTYTVYHCICHKAVHTDIHLIDLQEQVSTGQTQMKSRVQLTCNKINVPTFSTRSNPSFCNWIQLKRKSKVHMNMKLNSQVQWSNAIGREPDKCMQQQ